VGQIQIAIYFEATFSSGRLEAPRRKIAEMNRWIVVVAPWGNRNEFRTNVINLTLR